jgi:hypothetical protein
MIAFANLHDDFMIDRIPLSEIISIQANGDMWSPCKRTVPPPLQTGVSTFGGANVGGTAASDKSHTLEINTEPGGYNSGNAYYLQTNSDEELTDLLPKFKALVEIAFRRTKQITVGARIHKAIKAIFTNYYLQVFIAAMIILVRQPHHLFP